MNKYLFNFNHISGENLAAYINGDIHGKERDKIKLHLMKCSECFEHFATLKKVIAELKDADEISLEQRIIDEAKNIPLHSLKKDISFYSIKKNIVEFLFILKDKLDFQLSNMKPSVKLAYAFSLVLILGFSLLLVFQPEKTIQNIPLSDYLVISGEDPLGFVGEQERIEYRGMKVFLGDNENEIIFSWPEIKEAQFYNVYLIGDKKHQISAVEGLTTNFLTYQLNKIEMNKKYLWEITGRLQNGRMFQARSSFMRIDTDSEITE